MEREWVNEGKLERVILVGVETSDNHEDETDFERSMEELENLAKACFMETIAVVTQKMEFINKGLYIGTGKVAEVRELAEKLEADLIIFDNSLTPSQLRNLQSELGKPVMDRTNLILDIFESRAKTREAKLQVETARLQYLLPRLVGMHEALTRQGGTSGSMSSRGAGEKKLELDRRRIEHRLSELRKELDEVSDERMIQRKKRQSARIPLVALVGYTNAGKSTIMNAMVDKYVKDDDKKVLEKDMLFATLDTTVRRINTGNNKDFLLSDTVGFIHKLPHGLVKAFRSTLDEVKEADLLLVVVDYSDEHYKTQIQVVKDTIKGLEASDREILYVFNKVDKADNELAQKAQNEPVIREDAIYMSAHKEEHVRALIDFVLQKVYGEYVQVTFLFPYDKSNLVHVLKENAQDVTMEYLPEGTRVTALCGKKEIRNRQHCCLFLIWYRFCG